MVSRVPPKALGEKAVPNSDQNIGLFNRYGAGNAGTLCHQQGEVLVSPIGCVRFRGECQSGLNFVILIGKLKPLNLIVKVREPIPGCTHRTVFGHARDGKSGYRVNFQSGSIERQIELSRRRRERPKRSIPAEGLAQPPSHLPHGPYW